MKKFLLFLILLLVLYLGYKYFLPGYIFYKETLINNPLDKKIQSIENQKHYTEYGDVPPEYFKALVATEDRRYYIHNGLDIIGSLRAITVNLKERDFKEGGSTISQQLAKNLYFPLDYSSKRKIAEILMAMEIERQYSKAKILEIYVNKIYYGSGYYGIYDASRGYFHKKPKELTLDECTVLVGIPNAPSKYSLKVNPKLAYKRQSKVLKEMVEAGYITQEERMKIVKSHE